MQFRFDPNQEFQVKAIEAVTDLFDGQPRLGPAMHFAAGLHPVGFRFPYQECEQGGHPPRLSPDGRHV